VAVGGGGTDVGGGALVGGGAPVGGGGVEVGKMTGVGLDGNAARGIQTSWPTLNTLLGRQLTRINSSTGVLACAAKPARESPDRISNNIHPGGGETTQVSGVGVWVGVFVRVTVAVEVLVTVGVSSMLAGKITIGIRSLATSTSLPLIDSRRTCQFKLSPVAGSSFPVTGKR
jgi:hypothetical protein